LPTSAKRVLVLCSIQQIELARAVAQGAGAVIAGVASSHAVSGSSAFSDAAGAAGLSVVSEFRAALARTDAAAVVLLSLPDGPRIDPGIIESLRQRGVVVAGLEPAVLSVLDLQEPTLTGGSRTGDGHDDDNDPDLLTDDDPGVRLGPASGRSAAEAGLGGGGGFGGGATNTPVFCPLLRLSEPVRSAAEVIAQLGTIRTVFVESLAGPGEGSLGARVFDAADACVWLLGQPDKVDASYAPPLPASSGSGLAPPPPHPAAAITRPATLAGLMGDMTINLRYADGRSAAIVASSRAGRWQRSITLIGEGGRLKIFDDGLVWFAPDGRLVDSSRSSDRIRGVAGTDAPHRACAAAIADQLARLLDPHIPAPAPIDQVALLATTGAALLSARTGEGESPATVRRMAGA
jgi:hypothetical protein